MDIQNAFQLAVSDSKQLPAKPDNETLLKLYSLYKQATQGDNESAGPENPFDFVSKFKHEAWLQLKGTSKENAMQQYIELVNQLKA